MKEDMMAEEAKNKRFKTNHSHVKLALWLGRMSGDILNSNEAIDADSFVFDIFVQWFELTPEDVEYIKGLADNKP